MAEKRKPVSQSRTMWVKKGTVVNGKPVAKGYVAQYGKPERRVTGKVTLTRQTGSTAAGETVRYEKGRRVKPAAKPAASASRSQPAASRTAPARPSAPPAPAASQRQRPAVSAAERKKMGKGRKDWSDGARRTASASGTANAASGRSSTPSMSGSASAGSGRRAGGSASARVVSPASVAGVSANVRRAGQSAAQTAGSLAGFYAGITKSKASAILDQYNRGARKLTAAQRAALQRIVKGY